MVPPVPPIPSGQGPSGTTPGPSTRSRRGGKDPKAQGPGTVGRKGDGVDEEEYHDWDAGVAEEERPDSDIDFEGSGYDSEEDDEEDDEPDTINGLTYPEMEAVIQRASDGTISAKERTEAAMLMLGMAGGTGESLLVYVSSFPSSHSRH